VNYFSPALQLLTKLAKLPEPPPDSGEPPAPEESSAVTDAPHPLLHAAKVVGGGLASFGAGAAAGYGGQMAINHLFGKPAIAGRARAIAPVLGGAFGLAYNQYKSHEAEELRNALKTYQNQRATGNPSK
jgi:hypothetical protein